MNQDRIIKAYEYARDEYAEYGVNTDKVLEEFDTISMSLHCWQGDDVTGLEGLGDVESENLVTGSYTYAAKTGDELRSDIQMAFSLSPFKHKVNLHSMYAERKNPRNDLTIEDFRNWVDFAKEHADETLILVTGDHETGGLTIGFAGTDYDTYLDTLANQTISYAQFDEQYVKGYKENGTSFEDAMKDVETLFGLKLTGEENDRLVLTEYETQRLRTAYDLAMSDYNADDFTQEQYVLYGTYNPFSVTVTHILNNKAGVDFTSYSHTGLPVAVFADGVGAQEFGGYYDNTDIYNKLANLLEVK